jgi:hypothetical protein
MKKEPRSNLTFLKVRRTIVAAGFVLASSVGAAHAQAIQTLASPAKQTAAVERTERPAPIESPKKDDTAPNIGQPDTRATDSAESSQESLGDMPGSLPNKSSGRSSIASGWEFSIAPYLYMTGMKGTVGARGRTRDVDMSFGDVIENLNLGIMGAFEARKGRFVFVNDLMWIKLGEERDTPGQLFSSVKVGVNLLLWDPEAGYRVYQSDRGSVDVLGGARLMSVETNINFREGILPASDVSERKTWATPVVGVRGTLNVLPKVFLATKFDIGGGLGADFTTQFYGGAGYRITPKIALVGGYRFLKTDYDSEAGFLFDTDMNGILVGAKFTF